MLKVQYSQSDKTYTVEQLKYKDKNSIPVIPRRACTCI